jgi:predicted nucleotidyltransferase
MTDYSGLEAAVAQASRDLERASIPYMLIGGLALSAWNVPRATLDVDLTLWVTAEDLDDVCAQLTARYVSRAASPVEFVRKHRVLPVETAEGVRIDFIFAAFPFERTMLSRAVERRVGDSTVRVATREDLILLKLPSGRAKDRDDVLLILNRFGRELDWDYLLPLADQLAETLDQPQMVAFLHEHRARFKANKPNDFPR